MSERLIDTDSVFLDGSCFNYRCDVNNICKHYNPNSTAEQLEKYPVNPTQKCKAFTDTREVVIDTEDPDRPYLKSF